MESPVNLLLFVLGLVVLLGGAELLVHNALALSSVIGRSRLFIGLTVAAFGTSAPEIAIGVTGVIRDQSDIGIGNIIGSNIFNVLAVLGLAAVIRPVTVGHRFIQREVPILLAICVFFFLLVVDRSISMLDAVLLACVLIAYLWYVSRKSSEHGDVRLPEQAPTTPQSGSRPGLPWKLLLIVASVGLLAVGSHWMVTGAVDIAASLGMTQLVIGLTVVAIGTSLPEIATTLAAVRKREHDLVVGNIIGSCVFNILAVPSAMALAGLSSLPLADEAIYLDIPVMIVTVIACLPIFFSGHQISRREGALFLLYYAAFGAVLYIKAQSEAVWGQYRLAVALLIIPMVVITMFGVSFRAWQYRRESRDRGERS